MRITVELFGFPAGCGAAGPGPFPLEIDAGATVDCLKSKLALPEVPTAVLINGQRADGAVLLKEGDEAFIFTPALGG